MTPVNEIICGSAKEVMATWPSGSINCSISSMRSKEGQFEKGYTYRKPRPYWDRKWLWQEYIIKKKSATQIAAEQKCHKNNIYSFLAKHSIPSRTMKEVRKIKKWGLSGKANAMYGKTGEKNPNWDGGHSPERQSKYARSAWKELAKAVLKRDKYLCQDCGAKHTTQSKLVVHHIKAWSCCPELRFELTNLQTLCVKCHKKKHSRRKSIR